MESKYIRINFIVIIFFIIGMIYTTLQLFSLQDELILGVNTLTTDDISEISSVLSTVYITVALSLAVGLIAILLNVKTEQGTMSYQVSNSRDTSTKKSKGNQGDTEEAASDMDLSTVQNAIKSNSDKKDKHSAVLAAICNQIKAGQGAIYLVKENKEVRTVDLYTSYAFHISEKETLSFAFGEGLVGQVVIEGNTLNIVDIPENYINIVSGLGNASPRHLLITPLIKSKKVVGVVEIASFTAFSKEEEAWIKEGLSLLVNTTSKKTTSKNASKKDKTDDKNE